MQQKLETRLLTRQVRNLKLVMGLIMVLMTMILPGELKANHTPHIFPKRANYFLPWRISDSEARQLAKWDLLILDMETQATSRPQIELIRRLNPDIILLAYITAQEIRRFAGSNFRDFEYLKFLLTME